MESLRWRRFLLPLLMPVALVLCLGGVTTEVAGFGYVDSLTTPSSLPSVVTDAKESALLSTTKTTTTTNYLDSLQLRHNPAEGVAAAVATTTTTSPTTTDSIAIASTDDWTAETIAETPDDHYSKDHPGAGWAGYQHPMYVGYLDNLASISSSLSTENNSSSSSNNSSSNDNNDGTAAAAAATQDDAPSTTTSACVLEAGKTAEYGDDIRWGAQVYLDNLK